MMMARAERSNYEHIPLIESNHSVYEVAKDLIVDEKISLCRDTGIMRRKQSPHTRHDSSSEASSRSHRSKRNSRDSRNGRDQR